jgi:hypothetical protein
MFNNKYLKYLSYIILIDFVLLGLIAIFNPLYITLPVIDIVLEYAILVTDNYKQFNIKCFQFYLVTQLVVVIGLLLLILFGLNVVKLGYDLPNGLYIGYTILVVIFGIILTIYPIIKLVIVYKIKKSLQATLLNDQENI